MPDHHTTTTGPKDLVRAIEPPDYAEKDFGAGTSLLAAYRVGFFDARQEAVTALAQQDQPALSLGRDAGERLDEIAFWAEKRGMVGTHVAFLRDLAKNLGGGGQGGADKLERYEKALRFYADHRNYEDGDNEEIPGYGEADVNDDRIWTADAGYTARVALGIQESDKYNEFAEKRIPAEIRDAIHAALGSTHPIPSHDGEALEKMAATVSASTIAQPARGEIAARLRDLAKRPEDRGSR